MRGMRRLLAVVTALATLRCGTIVHGSTQILPVNSDPSGAVARLTCADGTAGEATTPGSLLLRRNAEACTLTVSKSGYQTETVALHRGKSSVMIGNIGTSAIGAVTGIIVGVLAGAAVSNGNLFSGGSALDAGAIIGGVIGVLTPGWIDARTGAMYRQDPPRVDVKLKPAP